MAGGLGDNVLQILVPGFDFGYFRAAKERWPDVERIVHLWYVTDSSRDLLLGHPDVDRLVFHDFDRLWESKSAEAAAAEGARQLTGEERDSLMWRQPEWALSPGELEHAAAVGAEPFIAFHPFAGDRGRDFQTNDFSPEACARAMCDAGARVVLLGGPSARWTGPGAHMDLTDDFDADSFGE